MHRRAFPGSCSWIRVIEESGSDADWDAELLVNGSVVDFKNDTGTDTVMTEMTFSKLQQRPKLTQSRL